MRTIVKYTLKYVETQKVLTYRIHDILSIQLQNNIPVMWVSVDTESNSCSIKIDMMATEDAHITNCHHFIGTLQNNDDVIHIFEDYTYIM